MAGRLLLILASILLGTPCIAQSKLVTLRPSKDYWDFARPAHLHVARLSPSRRLASIGDTLYMLDDLNRILWQWTSGGAPFTDTPIVDSTGKIYVIGQDLLWAAIDSKTGEEKWRAGASGRAAFWQIKPYRRDLYLIVRNNWGYRDSLQDRSIEDDLWLCKGTEVLWDHSIPAGARIEVSGSSVFEVYKHRGQLIRRRISVPPNFEKPDRQRKHASRF